MGIESCSPLPVKNTNVGEVPEERMEFIDREVREEMVGVSKPPLENPSLPSPLSVPSQPTVGNGRGTFQKLAINTIASAHRALTYSERRWEGRRE